VYVAESLTPSLQSVDNTTNATYYIVVENLGNMPDIFDLVASSSDNPDVLSLDRNTIPLGAGEISASVIGNEFKTIKLNVSDSAPGAYRVKVEANSRNDQNVRDSIETWTIVQGNISSTSINSTITYSALINSSITDSTVTRSAIINSTIAHSTITNSIINNSTIIETDLSDIMTRLNVTRLYLEDAIVNNGNISSGTITIYSSPGITFVIHKEIPISVLVIGSNYFDSNLVGLKYVTSVKSLIVDANSSKTGFDIYAKDDYFAGSLDVQRSTIPAFGINETDNNVGGYLFVEVSDNVEGSTHLVVIKVFYDPALPQEVINSLTLMCYDNNTAKWVPIPDQGINFAGNYVWGNLSHYSIFAMIAQPPLFPPAPALLALQSVAVVLF